MKPRCLVSITPIEARTHGMSNKSKQSRRSNAQKVDNTISPLIAKTIIEVSSFKDPKDVIILLNRCYRFYNKSERTSISSSVRRNNDKKVSVDRNDDENNDLPPIPLEELPFDDMIRFILYNNEIFLENTNYLSLIEKYISKLINIICQADIDNYKLLIIRQLTEIGEVSSYTSIHINDLSPPMLVLTMLYVICY